MAVKASPGPRVWLSTTTPLGSVQRWPWMWNVWKSLSIAKTLKATVSPTFASSVGVLPAYDRPLTQEKFRSNPVTEGLNEWNITLNSRVGRGAPALRINSGPNRPLNTGIGSIGP
jgi:hypothetical protein